MRLDHCNSCGRELELAFERYEIDQYIIQGDLHFCHDVCKEEFNNRNKNANNEPDNKRHNIQKTT